MWVGMAVGTPFDVAMATAAINFAGMRRPVGYVAFLAADYLFVFGMTIDTCRYVPVMFAIIHREVFVDIIMTGGAHFFCSGVFENGISDWKMRIAVTSEADASIPLCIF